VCYPLLSVLKSQELLVDYLLLVDPTAANWYCDIGAANEDGIVYVMPNMRDLTLTWEWRLIGAISKS
jgi:hypothetical protein